MFCDIFEVFILLIDGLGFDESIGFNRSTKLRLKYINVRVISTHYQKPCLVVDVVWIVYDDVF